MTVLLIANRGQLNLPNRWKILPCNSISKFIAHQSYPNYKLKSAVYFSMKILHSLLTEGKISLFITGINSLPSKKIMKINKSITPIGYILLRVTLGPWEKKFIRSINFISQKSAHLCYPNIQNFPLCHGHVAQPGESHTAKDGWGLLHWHNVRHKLKLNPNSQS